MSRRLCRAPCTDLDGVGDSQTNSGAPQLLLQSHRQQARAHYQHRTKQVAPECQPKVALHRWAHEGRGLKRCKQV